MAEPLRKRPLEVEEETIELEIVPGSALPGTPPAEDEARGREMSRNAESLARRTAETVASGMGKAVTTINSSVKSGIDVVSERTKEAGEKLSDVADETRLRAKELAIEAGRRAQDFREAAISKTQQARHEARQFAEQRPIGAILAIAGTAFVIGFVLRVWRSYRD